MTVRRLLGSVLFAVAACSAVDENSVQIERVGQAADVTRYEVVHDGVVWHAAVADREDLVVLETEAYDDPLVARPRQDGSYEVFERADRLEPNDDPVPAALAQLVCAQADDEDYRVSGRGPLPSPTPGPFSPPTCFDRCQWGHDECSTCVNLDSWGGAWSIDRCLVHFFKLPGRTLKQGCEEALVSCYVDCILPF